MPLIASIAKYPYLAARKRQSEKRMRRVKNIVFDFGGVLIDWNPVYLYRGVFDTEEEMHYFLSHICRYDWNLKQDAGRSIAVASCFKFQS